MRYVRGLIGLVILLIVFFSARPACAQDDPNFETGIKPYGSYNGGDIDTIGLTNGELSVDIPLISYPQKGGKLKLDFHFKCVQSGYYYDVGYIYDPYGNLIGTTTNWSQGSEFSGCYFQQKDVPFSSGAFSEDDSGTNYYASGQITMSDNSVHQLAPTSQYGPWRATDGSGFTVSGYADYGFTGPVVDSDGISYQQSPCYSATYVGAGAVDTNGNAISLTEGSNNYCTGWVDSIGRTIAAPVVNNPDNPSLDSECPTQYGTAKALMSWNPPGVNGGTYPILLCEAGSIPYNYYLWNTNNGQGEGWQQEESTTTAEYMMLVLPNHTMWVIQYTSDGNDDIQQVTFPTGGTISYTYENGAIFQDNHTFVSRQAVVTRTVNSNDGISPSGTWTYNYANPESVTDPQGNVTIHHMTVPTDAGSIYETETDFYQGSSTLLKRVNTTFTATGTAYPSYLILGALPTQVTTTWGNGQQSTVTYGYDSGFTGGQIWQPVQGSGGGFSPGGCCTYGKEVSKNEYDYTGSLLRTTNTSYQFQSNGNYVNANLLNLPATVQVTGAGPGSYTTYGYDETGCSSGTCGNQTSVHKWLNTTGGYLTTTKAYDPSGRLTSTTDPNNNQTTYGYGSCYAGSGPTSATNALNQTTSYCYDSNTGLETSVTDPNNNTTTTIYDSSHQMLRTSEIDYPDTGKTQFCYTDEATCAESGPGYGASVVISEAITSGTNKVSTVTVDGLGRLSQTQLNSDPDGTAYTEIQYDNLGHKSKVFNPTRCSGITSNCGESTWGYTTYGYDGLGRTTLVTDQDGSTVQTQYSGNSTTVTDEAGKMRQSYTDALGRLTTVVEDPNNLDYSTSYSYDVLGNLLGVTQAGSHQRSFVYDSLSRLTSATNPESGTTSYTYDANGNVLTKTDARGILTTYSYDALNRLTLKSYSDGTPSAESEYDQASVWGNTLTNTIGRLSRTMTSGNVFSASLYSYDSMGRVVGHLQCTPFTCGSGGWDSFATYNLLGGITSLENGGQGPTMLSQSFDGAGRLSSLTSNLIDGNHPGTLWTADATQGYYPHGALRKATFGNNLTEAISIESRLQPCHLDLNSSGSLITDGCADGPVTGAIQDFQYAYGVWGSTNNGDVTGFVGQGTQLFSRTYVYDALNRLQSMSAPEDQCSGLAWAYDAWGNRNVQNVTSGTCNSFNQTADANNHLPAPYEYDAAGNLLYDGVHSYTYDAESRITQVDGGATARYSYDAEGNRTEKTVGGTSTEYIYDVSGHLVGEDNGNSWQVVYAYAGERLVAQYNSNGTIYFIHQDDLGSTRLLTGVNGSLADSMDYLPFGEQIAGGTTTTHKFDGKERDSESGLDDFGARYYSSSLGRFVSADWSAIPEPVPYANLSNPQTLNLYAMVRDNPETFADLDGHQGAAEGLQSECSQSTDAKVCSPSPSNKQNLIVASQMKQSTAWERTKAGENTRQVSGKTMAKGGGEIGLGVAGVVGLLGAPETGGVSALLTVAGILGSTAVAGNGIVDVYQGAGGINEDTAEKVKQGVDIANNPIAANALLVTSANNAENLGNVTNGALAVRDLAHPPTGILDTIRSGQAVKDIHDAYRSASELGRAWGPSVLNLVVKYGTPPTF